MNKLNICNKLQKKLLQEKGTSMIQYPNIEPRQDFEGY